MEEDKTEDNTEDLKGRVSFSPVVMGGAGGGDSRGDLLVSSADWCSDSLFLSLHLSFYLSFTSAISLLTYKT